MEAQERLYLVHDELETRRPRACNASERHRSDEEADPALLAALGREERWEVILKQVPIRPSFYLGLCLGEWIRAPCHARLGSMKAERFKGKVTVKIMLRKSSFPAFASFHRCSRLGWYRSSSIDSSLSSVSMFHLGWYRSSSIDSRPRPRFEGCARRPSGQMAISANIFC
jgi:hypothetical protein